MVNTDFLIGEFRKEITKLWKKYKDSRNVNFFTEKTTHNSILFRETLAESSGSFPMICTVWEEELVEFGFNEERLNLFISEENYLTPLRKKYGSKFTNNHIRQVAWHEYAHTLTYYTNDFPVEDISTTNIPYIQFLRTFSDFWADYTLITTLKRNPTSYIRAKFAEINEILFDPRFESDIINMAIADRDMNQKENVNFFFLFYLTPIFYINNRWDSMETLFNRRNRKDWVDLFNWINKQFHQILTTEVEKKFDRFSVLSRELDKLDYEKIIREKKVDFSILEQIKI